MGKPLKAIGKGISTVVKTIGNAIGLGSGGPNLGGNKPAAAPPPPPPPPPPAAPEPPAPAPVAPAAPVVAPEAPPPPPAPTPSQPEVSKKIEAAAKEEQRPRGRSKTLFTAGAYRGTDEGTRDLVAENKKKRARTLY